MEDEVSIKTAQTSDGVDTFDVTVLEATQPRCVGLFAVGRGGNPMRHLPLLRVLAEQGCTIIAPNFKVLSSAIPTKAELDERIRRLEASADGFACDGQPLVGIGHSIGAVALLALAGGKGETLDGQQLASGSRWAFSKLALLAPSNDFFRRPGALSSVRVPMRVWVGAKDTITPPHQSHFLRQALEPQTRVDIRVADDAGHFTYMNDPPPHAPEPHPDRLAFLAALADEVSGFFWPERQWSHPAM